MTATSSVTHQCATVVTILTSPYTSVNKKTMAIAYRYRGCHPPALTPSWGTEGCTFEHSFFCRAMTIHLSLAPRQDLQLL